jgi:hypothetical protein
VATWSADCGGFQISATTKELIEFRDNLPFQSTFRDRVAELFWFDLYVLQTLGSVDPQLVIESIRTLELGRSDGVKAATQFQRLPLRGLWHQHYFSPRFVPKNMQLGLGRDGLRRTVAEVLNPDRSSVITQEMISELAHRVTVESIERRAAQNQLTGEWIIFVKVDNLNYYLCLADHQTGDQRIYDRIVDQCIRSFPDLLQWLELARSLRT